MLDQTTDLPAPSSEITITPEAVNLRQTIDDATQSVQEAKNKGGRPPGSKDKKPRAPYGSKKNKETATQASMPQAVPESSQLSTLPVIESVVRTPFDFFANKTGCEKIRATADELKPTVEVANQAFHLYFPELMEKNPKEMALISLATTLGMLTLTKYQAYSDHISKKSVDQTVSGDNRQNNGVGGPPPTSVVEPTVVPNGTPPPLPFHKATGAFQ